MGNRAGSIPVARTMKKSEPRGNRGFIVFVGALGKERKLGESFPKDSLHKIPRHGFQTVMNSISFEPSLSPREYKKHADR